MAAGAYHVGYSRRADLFSFLNQCRGNYSATSNNVKLLHWPLMGGLLHLVYSEERTERGPRPPRPLLAVPNVAAHPSTASVPITVLLYNGPLSTACELTMLILSISVTFNVTCFTVDVFNYEIMPVTLANTFLFILQGSD